MDKENRMQIRKQANKKCPCGSGKKFKNCCMNKKPRTTIVTMDMGEPVQINSLSIDNKGNFKVFNDKNEFFPQQAFLEINYPREKSPKTLLKIPLKGSELSTNIYSSLNEKDILYAVDTNTMVIGKESISTSAILLCKINKDTADYAPVAFMAFRNQTNPEKNAWKHLIKLIMQNPNYSDKQTFKIIVDSDLGNLHKYNSREIPIHGDFYLPTNFSLIYASSDSGSEYLPNKLIRECDILSRNFYKESFEGSQTIDLVKDKPYIKIL